MPASRWAQTNTLSFLDRDARKYENEGELTCLNVLARSKLSEMKLCLHDVSDYG
jgi:hypothetical protein